MIRRSRILTPSLALSLFSVAACRAQNGAAVPPDHIVIAQPAGSTAPAMPQSAAPPPPPAPLAEPEPEIVVPPPVPGIYVDASRRLAELAEGNTTAWDRLAYMCDIFGHRFSGSKSLEESIDWAIQVMKDDGLDNPRREKVMIPKWVRGNESLVVTAPVKRELTILGLGGTIGTGGRGVKGEVAVVSSLDEIMKRGESLKGKIVVINQAMPAFDHEHNEAGYGKTRKIRSNGAVEASKVGAKAVLIRSVTAHSLQTPHTGAMSYEDGVKKIPAAAVTVEGAEFLARMAKRGPISVHLKLGAKKHKDVASANAIAEIRGRELPDEVVVIGGHIDSWDTGQGASDDGAGVLMAMEAAHMLKQLGLVPKRTIRVVLFTNEENGLQGGTAYLEAHRQEKHIAAIESDSGGGMPLAIGIGGPGETNANRTALELFKPLFEPFGIQKFVDSWGGADIYQLEKIGAMMLSIDPDGSWYFDIHHTPADTVEKIDAQGLQHNAAAMALMAFILAERGS